MIKSLFDNIEEEPQTKIETIHEPEVQPEPKGLPEDKVLLSLPEEEISLEIPDLNEVATIQTPILQPAEIATEILPPTEIPILHNAETIAPPEISVSHDAKTIDELRMQSNVSNTRNPLNTSDTETKSELIHVRAKPESIAETARNSGLAMSAAITLFASVVFLLIIGWFADLLLGTSPWGKVGGIVLGSLIGFFQFFRMTSQILKDKD